MLVWHGDAGLARIRLQADQLEDQIAKRLLHNATQEVPVDTGALMLSGHVNEGQAGEVIVVYPKRYAKYVEFGTVKMAPRAFLRSAVMQTVDEVKSKLGIR